MDMKPTARELAALLFAVDQNASNAENVRRLVQLNLVEYEEIRDVVEEYASLKRMKNNNPGARKNYSARTSPSPRNKPSKPSRRR